MITVKPHDNVTRIELSRGERRWYAAKTAGNVQELGPLSFFVREASSESVLAEIRRRYPKAEVSLSPLTVAEDSVQVVALRDGYHLIVEGRDVAKYADKGAAMAGRDVEIRRLMSRNKAIDGRSGPTTAAEEAEKTAQYNAELVRRYQANEPLSRVDTKEARRLVKRAKRAEKGGA